MLGVHRGCIILMAQSCQIFQISPNRVNQIDGAEVWATWCSYGKSINSALHLEQSRESTGALVAIARIVIFRHQFDHGRSGCHYDNHAPGRCDVCHAAGRGNMRLSAAGIFTAARKSGGQDHDVNLACTLRYALPKSLASYHLLWGPSGHNEAKPRR